MRTKLCPLTSRFILKLKRGFHSDRDVFKPTTRCHVSYVGILKRKAIQDETTFTIKLETYL
jgi:hypothetical protein